MRVTPIRVKTKRISNLYVLIIHVPGDRNAVAARFTSRRPWAPFAVGESLRLGRKRVRIIEIIRFQERRGEVLEHIAEVFTRAVMSRRRRRTTNVVTMPEADDQSVIAQFIRYHVLVRVFGGDPDAWLADIRARGGNQNDVRFIRWVRSRLRRDPALLTTIRSMVDATPFWHGAPGVM